MNAVLPVLGWSADLWTTWSHLNSIGREINREDIAPALNKSTQLHCTHLTDLTTDTFPVEWKKKTDNYFVPVEKTESCHQYKAQISFLITAAQPVIILVNFRCLYWRSWLFSKEEHTYIFLEYSFKCSDYFQNDVKLFLLGRYLDYNEQGYFWTHCYLLVKNVQKPWQPKSSRIDQQQAALFWDPHLLLWEHWDNMKPASAAF